MITSQKETTSNVMAKKYNQPIHPLIQMKFSYATFRVLKIFSAYLLGCISLATNKYYCFQSKAKMYMIFVVSFTKTDFILSYDRKFKEKRINETYYWNLQSILLTHLIGKVFPFKKMNQYKCVKAITSSWMKIMEELYPNEQRFWKMLKISISITVFSTPMPRALIRPSSLKKNRKENMKLHIGYPWNMFRRRAQPYITYLWICDKVNEFYDFRRLRFLAIFTPWMSRKYISIPLN